LSLSFLQITLKYRVGECIDELASEIIGFVPIAGCVYNLLTGFFDPLVDAVVTRKKKPDTNPFGLAAITTGSLLWGMTKATVGCIPGINAPKIIATTLLVGTTYLTTCTETLSPDDEIPRKEVQPVASFDPNDKLGLDGAGANKYIQGTEIFPYLIRFENKPTATAAAQTVLIIDTLDKTKLDLSSLQLGFISFNNRIINIPPGRKNYTAYVDLRPAQDLTVKIEAKLDERSGVLTWLYTSLDPTTRKLTQNPDAGFLPPNKTTPEGEGGVFFTIRPKNNLITNDDIKNRAYIYFDNNEVIPTPTWSNAIDKMPPVSQVSSLPQTQADSIFTVRWSGNDEGAGISNYSVYVSVNNKPYTRWLNKTTDTLALFEGKRDSTYRFYSIAQDSTGILEAVPATADATTTIAKVTGLEEDLAKQVKVYPNPVVHTLIVELPQPLRTATLTLINVHGGIVSKMEGKNRMELSLKVNQFAKGLYLLRITDGKSIVVKKVIIE